MKVSIALKIYTLTIPNFNLLAMTWIVFESIRLREHYKNLIMVENSKYGTEETVSRLPIHLFLYVLSGSCDKILSFLKNRSLDLF